MLPTAPKCVCMKCGSQNIYNTNQIDFTQHEPLVECQFGINAKRDLTYEYVLNMSQEDLINTLSSHFIKEYIRNGETNITEEMLQRKFSEKTTKQLVRKLVKFIREKDDDNLPKNVQQELAEVKAQRISLGRKLQYQRIPYIHCNRIKHKHFKNPMTYSDYNHSYTRFIFDESRRF